MPQSMADLSTESALSCVSELSGRLNRIGAVAKDKLYSTHLLTKGYVVVTKAQMLWGLQFPYPRRKRSGSVLSEPLPVRQNVVVPLLRTLERSTSISMEIIKPKTQHVSLLI